MFVVMRSPVWTEDGCNQYIFPLAIKIAKSVKSALVPLYLGTLYARPDECIQNIPRSVGRYDVVPMRTLAFHRCLWTPKCTNIA